MKKLLMSLFILLMFVCTGCASKKDVFVFVEAEVLSIDSQILEGKLIGQFLGSSSGFISNDVIKVGVSFKIKDKLFLRDLELNHAELTYYKDNNILLLEIKIKGWNVVCGGTGYPIEIRLNGRIVDSFYLSKELRNKLVN